ncbi:MAG: hypothetical protein A2W31_17360 [Planctomycetes bacterium RBG_16_64_10]|nr:MAG: hypothetical protein A2W31_17360 [Planctomycetes bacterium RBG_16_64_10]
MELEGVCPTMTGIQEEYAAIDAVHFKLQNTMRQIGAGSVIAGPKPVALQFDGSMFVHLETAVFFLSMEMRRLQRAINALDELLTSDYGVEPGDNNGKVAGGTP